MRFCSCGQYVLSAKSSFVYITKKKIGKRGINLGKIILF